MGIVPKQTQKKKLTKKQTALVKAVADPSIPTIAKAGRMAGYYDRQAASKALQLTTVREALADLSIELTSGGVDNKALAGAVRNALEANETKFFTREGVVTEAREVPNHAARLKAVEIVIKLRALVGGGMEAEPIVPIIKYNYEHVPTEELRRSIDEQIRTRIQARENESDASAAGMQKYNDARTEDLLRSLNELMKGVGTVEMSAVKMEKD